MTRSSADIRAAIDLGTVSSRLLVARVDAHVVEPIVRRTIITHMGEGLVSTGRISDEAIKRVFAAVATFKETLAAVREDIIATGVECPLIPIRAVATSAMRDASNSAEIVALLADNGINVEVIEGAKEAELSFRGTLSGFPTRDMGTIMIIDVGGGSTEVVIGEYVQDINGAYSFLIEKAISFNIGSRRVTELFLRSDPPAKNELESVRDWIAEETKEFLTSLTATPDVVFAVAGVATTIVSILKGMEVYDPDLVHGTKVPLTDLDELLISLASLSLDQRRNVKGLQPDRAPVIVGGCIVFSCILHIIGADSFIVSETDILQGILLT